jgi:L,D-peptidoglycan transpeptidase YkuD (ErfK/YbiS/YcfS/YnhG family)
VKLAALALVACSTTTPATIAPATAIPARSTQLVTAVIDGWDATTATLQLWHREHGAWQPAGDAWPAVIGSTGAAWGDGLHGSGAPAGRSGPRKHEGDRKSPAGTFALRSAYGYAAAPPAGTRWPYEQATDDLHCVDDPASHAYATITHGSGDWHSAEQMRRPDDLYTWVVDVSHNPARVAGDGSCIFLHVWHGADSTTVGCTAMAEPALAHLIGALDPAASPVFVLLPRAEYAALAGPWGLPPLPSSARLGP